MSKQHVLDIIQTAQGRAAAIDATAPGFAFNKTLSVEGYHASIDEAREVQGQHSRWLIEPVNPREWLRPFGAQRDC